MSIFKKSVGIFFVAFLTYWGFERWLTLNFSRLEISPETTIDNYFYDQVDWWKNSGPVSPLSKMNYVRVPYFARHLNISGKILDIGCGGGLVTEELAVMGFSITGMDMSENSLRQAGRHAEKSAVALDVNYVQGNALHLPFSDGSFDGVVISDVLEHIEDLPRSISEISRVLRPGGVLVFDTINRTPFSFFGIYLIAQELFQIIPKNAHSPSLFIQPEELFLLLKRAGFESTLDSWSGIVANLSPVKALRTWNANRLISGFFESPTDLSGSYQGWARKV